MAIYLLIMSEITRQLEIIGVPRQEALKTRMAFSKYTLMKQAEDSNISPKCSRSEIVIQKNLFSLNSKFGEKTILHGFYLAEQSR